MKLSLNLIETLLLFIQAGCLSISSFHVSHEVLHLSLQSLLRLLQRRALGIDGLISLLRLLQALSKFLPGRNKSM